MRENLCGELLGQRPSKRTFGESPCGDFWGESPSWGQIMGRTFGETLWGKPFGKTFGETFWANLWEKLVGKSPFGENLWAKTFWKRPFGETRWVNPLGKTPFGEPVAILAQVIRSHFGSSPLVPSPGHFRLWLRRRHVQRLAWSTDTPPMHLLADESVLPPSGFCVHSCASEDSGFYALLLAGSPGSRLSPLRWRCTITTTP